MPTKVELNKRKLTDLATHGKWLLSVLTGCFTGQVGTVSGLLETFYVLFRVRDYNFRVGGYI